MIETFGLTKQYVGQTAVDGVSFRVEKGEIVGFLGPNGAGKSTTIRMLTCFLTPTAGRAEVAGYDIAKDSLKVRAKIGYMPENVPLYPDLRVREYLSFRGALKGMGRRELSRGVSRVIETCSLTAVADRIVGTLSKGFRQRVALADALIHDPELLILDEPTNGLDPEQIRLFRDLIRQLGEKHTIFLSTHILPEVEMTCGRVLIINRGRLVASDSPGNLVHRQRQGSDIVFEVRAAADPARAAIEQVGGIESVLSTSGDSGWSRFRIHSSPDVEVCEALHDLAVANRWKVRELSRRDPSLEDAFVNLVRNDQAATAAPETEEA